MKAEIEDAIGLRLGCLRSSFTKIEKPAPYTAYDPKKYEFYLIVVQYRAAEKKKKNLQFDEVVKVNDPNKRKHTMFISYHHERKK